MLAVPVIVLGFDSFFTRFHEMFFEGDSWRFADTDTLIRVYPEGFWVDVSRIAAALTVGQALVVAGLCLVVASSCPPEDRVIELRRKDGEPVLRIGHRGAAHLAPENTLRALRAAVEHEVDLVEFDVLDLPQARSSSHTRITSTR